MGQRPGKAYRTGKSAYENKEYIRAIGWLDVAINSQKKKYNDAYIYRAKSHLALDREEKALKDFIIASKLFPNNYKNALQASRLSYKLGKHNQALQYATTTLDRDSANFDALKLQALALIHTGSSESALIVCERAQKLNEDAELLYAKALASDSLGLNDYAIAYYNEAIKINPVYKPPYHDLGRLLVKNDYIDKAIDIFSQAARRFNDIESYRLRAILYNVTGNTQAQIKDITKIITLNPARIDLYYTRAELYKKVNQLQNALVDISYYLKWDTTSANAWLLKGKILKELYMKSEAIQAFINVDKYTTDSAMLKYAESSIYELRKEQYPPQIIVTHPEGPGQTTIAISRNQQTLQIKGVIKDDSPIAELLISGKNVPIKNKSFDHQIVLDTMHIVIKATDTYGNTSSKTYRIIETEKTAPTIVLNLPKITNTNVLVAAQTNITIKGYIEETSNLKELVIGNKKVNFTKKGNKYYFSDQLDIKNIDTLKIAAEDYFSNTGHKEFPVIIPDSVEIQGSPMGKTWVLIIATDSIKNNKINQVVNLRKALTKNYSKFIIDSLIVWKNMTKEKLERELLFKLPQMARINRVNALLIHYIGPGITQGAYTYWVTNTSDPAKKYGELNTSILRTVTEALEQVKYKTIISESVNLSENMVRFVDSCTCENCIDIQRFPDGGQFFLSLKIDNLKGYASIVDKHLNKAIESQKRCFSPSMIHRNGNKKIKIGRFRNLNERMFPVILYLKESTEESAH